MKHAETSYSRTTSVPRVCLGYTGDTYRVRSNSALKIALTYAQLSELNQVSAFF